MYTIGEFAAYGRVSVRMLRHYDGIGLLVPARVDERTGYRYYDIDQLPQLLRVTDLRALGCGLDEIRSALTGADALRGVLEHRETELEASVAVDTARLARVRERLHILKGTVMSDRIEYKDIPAVTVYEVRATAPGMGPEFIGPVIGPLFSQLHTALVSAGVEFSEPGIAVYESVDASESIVVRAAFVAGSAPESGDGFAVAELPPISSAATIVHHGEMARIGETWMSLVDALTADGKRLSGSSREVYLVAQPLPETEWVTELQQPVDQ